MSNKPDKKAKDQNLGCFDDSGNKVSCDSLIVHGTEYKTTLTKKYLNRKKWVKTDPNNEISYIPGTILETYIRDGESIKKGQPLLILMAMKMENTIFAPFDCKVRKVHVKNGDIIPKGTVMVEYE